MSKIKFDEKDFNEKSNLWGAVMTWACDGDPLAIDKTVQRLIKKYVKRERKRLARSTPPIWTVKSELIEVLKQEREKVMSWPADFEGKH